jgi:hypothetical protein
MGLHWWLEAIVLSFCQRVSVFDVFYVHSNEIKIKNRYSVEVIAKVSHMMIAILLKGKVKLVSMLSKISRLFM